MTVVERMSDLVHDEVGMPEEAVYSIVKVNANVVLVFLKTEVPEVKVL